MNQIARGPGAGGFDPAKGYFTWEMSLYYDDIAHMNLVHHSYFLRFFEHAREHMLSQDFLPSLLETENIILVAVKTDQTQTNFIAPRLGDRLNIRTKVQIDGKYRIHFVHEAWHLVRSQNDKPESTTQAQGSESRLQEGSEQLMVKGTVEMVCLDADKMSLVPLPPTLTDELVVNKLEKPKRPLKKPIKTNRKNQVTCFKYSSTVSDYDTDFTRVVYQAKYLGYYENARRRLFKCMAKQSNENFERLLESNGCFCAVYKADVTFKNSLMPDDDFEIETTVDIESVYRLGFQHKLYRVSEGNDNVERSMVLVNQAKVELICLEVETRKMIQFPATILEWIQANGQS